MEESTNLVSSYQAASFKAERQGQSPHAVSVNNTFTNGCLYSNPPGPKSTLFPSDQ
jgi:hypothetical protein